MSQCYICGKKKLARDMCIKHYTRWRNHGDPHYSLRKRASDKRIIIHDDHAEIECSGGKFAIVGLEDVERCTSHSWSMSKTYPMATINKKKMPMHTFITGYKLTDHIDGNPLNNLRRNLRPANRSTNAMNSGSRGGSSRYKGVRFEKKSQKWCAEIWKNRKKHWLGRHESEELAALAYNEAAEKLHGEFAFLNPL